MKSIKKKAITVLAVAAAALITIGCVRTVKFASGSYKSDATELSVVVTDGETELLNKFPDLTSVDLSGSANYSEIEEWAAAHPAVRVIYTVTFPNGTAVSSDAESADLSGITHDMMEETASLLPYLHSLKTIDFGSSGDLTAEDLAMVRSACPTAEIVYTHSFSNSALNLSDTTADLTGLKSGEVADAAAFLSVMNQVDRIVLTEGDEVSDLDIAQLTQLADACPDAVLEGNISLYSTTVNLADDTLNLSHIPVDDNGALVRQVLPLMHNCTTLDMDTCGVDDETMASIRDDFPDVKVVWRIWFGRLYSVRTDVETILASNPDKGGLLTPDQTVSLKYCTDVINLDLGHNDDLTDISFLNYMPKMETLIIMGCNYTDATPLASLKNLDYLEMQTNGSLKDISPVGQCTNLHHLNMCYMESIKDMSGLYTLTNLERLWIGCITPVPESQIQKMQELNPNCEINTTTTDPVLEGWRYTFTGGGILPDVYADRYAQLRDTFNYGTDIVEDDSMYSYWYNDPLCTGMKY